MGRRITRKQLKQDEFVSVVDSVVDKASNYWRPLVAGLGAVFVLVLLWGVISWWTGSRSEDAARLLYQAVQAYEGDETASVGTDPAAAEARFEEVVDRYGRTDQADVARLYLARIAISRGEGDRARELLRRLTRRTGDDALKQVATVELLHLRVAAGQGVEVAQELEAMLAAEDPQLPRDVAIYELATTLQENGEPDRAREFFDKLVNEFPESPYREAADQALGELGAGA
jgi:predicted negative regulator of RcsB-dependent stress response